LHDEEDVRFFIGLGFNRSLSYQVIHGERVIASISFYRKRDQLPFNEYDQQRLAELPIAKAIGVALHYAETADLRFTLDLIRKVSASRDTHQIAVVLANEIRDHYQWENVSIFRPDEREKKIFLVEQSAEHDAFLLPRDWNHPIEKGITGLAYRTGRPINVSNLKDDRFAGVYLEGYLKSASELCVPIIIDGRVYWLLNAEDSKENAFSEDEQHTLESILREVALVLGLVSQHQLRSEILRSVSDGFIRTDYDGNIQEINAAVEDLLGYTQTELTGTSLGDYFKRKDQSERILESARIPNDEVSLVRKDGKEIAVLLSGAALPSFGIKVYIANDLRQRKRIETLEILRHMYNEIATQIKTPLSLAFTWLKMLQKREDRPENRQMLASIVQQLHRADLSYDRLLFYERHKIPYHEGVFDIPFVVKGITAGIPESEVGLVDIRYGKHLRPVSGDLYQISFCIESILSYLLRFASTKSRIRLEVAAHNRDVLITIKGYAPRFTGGQIAEYTQTRWAVRAITEIALAQETMKRFIEVNNKGVFYEPVWDGEQVIFRFELRGV